MKRFIAVLSGLLVMPAFAEVAPIYYDDSVEYTDDSTADYTAPVEDQNVQDVQEAQPVNPVIPEKSIQHTITARAASRAVPSTSYSATERNTTQRVVSNRTADTVRARDYSTTTASRSTAGQTNQNVVSRRNTTSSANSSRAASLTQTDTVNTPLYIGRVSVRPTSTSSVVSRAPTTTVRAATTTSSSSANTTSVSSMDEIAQTSDYCKAQFTQCMDNFCNVLDDNQGRCSCSANIKNYAKTEAALKEATQNLQDVAQKIQYIGLSKDEVSSLFTQTEAEAAMQGKSDTTQLKTDLDKIKSLILDVKSANATSSTSSSTDLLSSLSSMSFDNSGFDLSEFLGGDNANSISNQRGAELYKTATARCKAAVLDSCKSQGVDTTIITNSYDLEIDKQCIAYERSLTDANSQMTTTLTNAQSFLQKARLLVVQKKNTYTDMRSCISALDSCMQDDFVCGSDYENCLDPTGKYIVNGKVVVGSQPGVSGGNITSTSTSGSNIYATWNYATGTNNAWGTGNIGEYVTNSITAVTPVTNMIVYLQNKIGYNDSSDSKNYGMCISVLNQCQDFTYTGTNKTFNKSNDVIKGYLQNTLAVIKNSQDEILSKYAESCLSDVASCLSTNGYSSTSTVTKASARNACSSYIRTCTSITGAASEDDVVTAATDTD
ncbi:MAG TPA: hypothetical protein PKJ33_03620 [Alphaproteobacteria bacterium]|nr:hypothetical protein [Alphaproteobacteria bacterium]